MVTLSINLVTIVVSSTTRFGDLELASSPSGFSAGLDALRVAATMANDDVGVRVACLDDVITSKEAPGGTKTSKPFLISSTFGRSNRNWTGDDDLHEDVDRQCPQRACLDTTGNPLISTKPVAA